MKTKTNLFKQVVLLAMLIIVSLNHLAVTSAKFKHGATGLTDKEKLPAQPSKHYDFGELRSGDCVMQAGGKLDIFPDGHAEFRATVWTNHTHSGDTWHHHVYFKDAAGAVIFQIVLDGPNHMNDDGSRYAFSSNFNFPPGLYYAINLVAVQGSC
jgi:hypothetical protein